MIVFILALSLALAFLTVSVLWAGRESWVLDVATFVLAVLYAVALAFIAVVTLRG